MWEILLPVFGLLIGILASMTGVGGGAIIVPLLSVLYAFSPTSAIGTSLATIIFTATAATITYWHQKRIFFRTGILLAVATAPGAVIGAYLTTAISATVLSVAFGVFLILVAVRMLMEVFSKQKQQNASTNQQSESELFHLGRNRIYLAVFLGFLAGIASGLLGVGGGLILVPLIVFTLGVDMHIAVATSMFTIIFTSLSGVGQHYLLGNVNLTYAFLLGAGSMIGTQIGAYIYKRASNRALRGIFAVILLAISIEMIIKFL
jgi:uncharacterized membrane protein YfcA